MKMNYNDWFYEFHKYFTAYDTSWVDIGNRYKRLQEINSDILQQQPFGVMGNKTGFEKLLNLMAKSNYSFKDVDDAMVKTYEQTLRRAMGKMLVNTHSVIYHATNLGDKSIRVEHGSPYYIADVPYDQLHFGERDEFIRQKLNKMNDSVNQQYIHVSEFTTNAFTKILDFSVMCTINGKICNEFYVGFNDHGFRFKFAYGGLQDAEVIIYKLDQAKVTTMTVKPSVINGTYLRFDTGDVRNEGHNCIVDIYMEDYIKQVQVVPNFGYIDKDGILHIPHLQIATLRMLEQYNTSNVTILIYHTKFLHEINGIFPALNYMNFTHNRPVYTDLSNPVVNLDGNEIVASVPTQDAFHNLPKCTPPICIDRSYDLQFDVLLKCVNLYNFMLTQQKTIIEVGNVLYAKSFKTYEDFQKKIVKPLKDVYRELSPYYVAYTKGALLTSLVNQDLINEFSEFLNDIDKLTFYSQDDWDSGYDYRDLIHPAFYPDAYVSLMERLSDPYRTCETLRVFANMEASIENFFSEAASPNRFNRPVAEQCFISLAYSKDDQAWVFAYPKIKRFKGIENAFYIDEDLYEDDVFKFFVLYTDTFYPSAQEIDDSFDMEDILDYDAFITETERYLGFIRYWDVENQLMKLSKVLYGKYDDQTVVQVMSDLLRGRIDTKDLVYTDWSEIQYDRANITSDNFDQYDDTSERAPFALNYLFYTLSMLNDGDDNSQAMFYHILTNDKFNERYLDYNISKAFENQPKITMNFAQFYTAFVVNTSKSVPKNDGKPHLYYGLPSIYTGTSSDSTAYPFVFTDYSQTDTKYLMIDNMSTDKEHYMMGTSIARENFYYNIQLAKICTRYLNCIRDLISYLETNYKIGVNHTFVVESTKESLQKIYDELVNFQDTNGDKLHNVPNASTITDMVENEPFLKHGTKKGILDKLLDVYLDLQRGSGWSFGTATKWNNDNTRTYILYQNLYKSVNWWLKCLRHMYYRYGFKTNTIRRVRNMYLYFKKFHKLQNIYQFKQLHLNLDKAYLDNYIMQDAVSVWDQIASTPATWKTFNYPNTMQFNSSDFLKGLNWNLADFDTFDTIMNSITLAKTSYLRNMENWVDLVMKNWVFDMYVIDDIWEYNDGSGPNRDEEIDRFDKKPAYVEIKITRDADHPQFYPPYYSIPIETPRTLYFGVATQYIDKKYVMRRHGGYRKICEYVFFDGTPIKQAMFTFYDENGDKIADKLGNIYFRKVANSAQLLPPMEMLYNTSETHVDLQNIHENMTVNDKGCTVVSKVNASNYEMLYANRYQQLQHTSEMILQRKTMLPGSIDRVWISNQDINQFILSDLGSCPTTQLFFKPSQILHPEKETIASYQLGATIQSIGGKYFEGQKIYITTNDDLHYTFPAFITAIDHSRSRGFVEAKVDHRHANWIAIEDKDLINQYLTSDIECTVLDDNISNFLDEFSNPNYKTYYNPSYDPELEFYDEDYPDMLSVPGDPVYVYTHGDYVYTRVNSMFHHAIPNQYLDEQHKRYRFHYMGWNCFHYYNNASSEICIQLMNVNRSLLTDPELYPILRDEPNDHNVVDLETVTYKKLRSKLRVERLLTNEGLRNQHAALERAVTIDNQIKHQREIERLELYLASIDAQIERLEAYIDEPEHMTTWYNVPSYEAAQTYLNNDRTKLPRTYQFDVRDIPMTSKLEVLLYNWDKKEWIDPTLYHVKTVATDTYPYTNFDTTDVYDEYNVRTFNRVYIQFDNNITFPETDRILIYFAYQTSDVFDQYELNDKTCKVRFKPILSTNNNVPDDPDEVKTDVYDKLCIRKHLDLHESYYWDHTLRLRNDWADIEKDHGITGFHAGNNNPYEHYELCYIRRPGGYHRFGSTLNMPTHGVDINGVHRGRIPYTPVARFCHLTVIAQELSGDKDTKVMRFDDGYDQLSIFVRNPFKDTNTDAKFRFPKYTANVIQNMDNFVSGEKVKLICVNTKQSNYNGNISSIMFEGIVGVDADDNQTITITSSTIQNFQESQTYTCTVFHDSGYSCIGGLIVVNVTSDTAVVMNNDGSWIALPYEYALYHEIPDEFIVSFPSVFNVDTEITIKIDVEYQKGSEDKISKYNHNPFNPMDYYYDIKYKIRYPISNIRHEQYDQRLTYNDDGKYISGADHEHRQVVRSNHLHVCRYSLYNIPQNGFIDVTGYIPTPLSRRRYEFWVNGRQLIGNTNLIILSPTSFQLINLTSLKNFELIELVDDIEDNVLSNVGNVYVDLEGNVYGNYQQAFLSNHEIIGQSIRYSFYGYPNHTSLQDVTMGFITNPNNVDVETNIMDYWNNGYPHEDEYDDYNDYYNIPKINGVSIYHPTSDDLGMREIPNYQILPYFDKAWKKEILTNPLFPMTHFDGSMTTTEQFVLLHILEQNNAFTIYTTGTYSKYFTLYVSKREDGSIADLENTVQIIPFIHVGTRVILDTSVRGYWLHATVENYIPQKIQ